MKESDIIKMKREVKVLPTLLSALHLRRNALEAGRQRLVGGE